MKQSQGYKVRLSNKSAKQLESFPRDLQERVMNALFKIRESPKAGKPLKWRFKGDWSFRVGNYRIVYTIDEKEKIVWIIHIKHRRKAYP
jgi:mRNA interferase RelE/StbE